MLRRKEYTKPFKLDETKLTSIAATMHSRLAEGGLTPIIQRFEAFTSASARTEVDSLDDLLAQENSRRHPIERLLLTTTSAPAGDPSRRRELVVDFSTDATLGERSTQKEKVVAISVNGDATSWTTLTLSAIEEQVERTWQHGFIPSVLSLIAILIAILAILLTPFLSLSETVRADSMWLTRHELSALQKRFANGEPLSEGEVRNLTTAQLKNVMRERLPTTESSHKKDHSRLFILLPSIVVVICAVLLIWRCYPKAIFYWGDGIERYEAVLKLRKTLWTVILGITVLAVLGNMLSMGTMATLFPN